MIEFLQSFLQPILQPIADWFAGFNFPEPIVHWGHPVMMGIVILAMGSAIALTGWQIRLNPEAENTAKSRFSHRKLGPWMSTFLAMGYSGGLLSLVMQHKPILESPHFWTGTIALVLLGTNGMISLSGFGGQNPALRSTHAYLGSFALVVLLVHAALGLGLGFSI
ncbi:MAG: DUF4079 domain-containing protein [Prochlorotrichaceae cyanobacterium]|jgi:hypothetical protein